MRYCAYYCEENVWHLCHDPAVRRRELPVPIEERAVVFVSNPTLSVLMRHQRAGRGGDVQWDYHVVLLALGDDGWDVWDLDCVLGWPLPLARWLAESFPAAPEVTFAPLFRVIPAARFVEVFASDRRHMLGPTHAPLQPPPPWPPILAAGHESNLMRFVDMTVPFEGLVLNAKLLRVRFAAAPSSTARLGGAD